MLKNYAARLDGLTTAGDLSASVPDSAAVRCLACAHRCRLAPGARGRCALRFNRDGTLMVPYGYTSSLAVDPVEKKPFYHFLPGHRAFSFGMLGCNLQCSFCQNWTISQVLRDDEAVVSPKRCDAGSLVAAARQSGSSMIASTYNEPLITAEWAASIFRSARAAGLKTCMVSNGFASPEALTYLGDCVDAMNVDLKCYSEEGYRALGGRLQPVLETIAALWSAGTWVEVITLVIPGFNDTDAELRGAAEFLAGVSPDVPWHVSAYHADYKMKHGPPFTPPESLDRALRIGENAGLRHVYTGNAPRLLRGTDTLCPQCALAVVTRGGSGTRSRLDAHGYCPGCGTRVAGVWSL